MQNNYISTNLDLKDAVDVLYTKPKILLVGIAKEKCMNEIWNKQNLPENIDLLKAQAAVYKETEIFSNIDFFLSTGATALLVVLKILFFQLEIWGVITGIVAAIVTIGSFILSLVISNRKDLAARMQMMFDCNVLSINWNDAVLGRKPKQEEIDHYKVIQTRKDESTFNGWYNVRVKGKPLDVARILAYQENISYDVNLREAFIAIISILCIFLLGISVYLFVIGNSFWLALIPLFAFLLKVLIINIWSLFKFKAVIDDFNEILDLLVNRKYVGVKRFNSLFHSMYEHRRRTYKIPDKVFHVLKKILNIKSDYDQLLIMEKMGRI